MDLKSVETYRLFYMDVDFGFNGDDYRMAVDVENMSKIIEHLNEIDLNETKIFGLFGDNAEVENYLNSLFPSGHSKIKSLFTHHEEIPAIWTIFNEFNFVFVLMSNEETTLNKVDYFTVVMQRFLQDMCQDIVICPSDSFFVSFSTDHAFQNAPHKYRQFKLIKQEFTNIVAPRNIQLNDRNILASLVAVDCQNVLITNTNPTTYCSKQTWREASSISSNDRIDKLKELLEERFDISKTTSRDILNLCQKSQISLSRNQMSEIEKQISDYRQSYNREKISANQDARSCVGDLIGKYFWSYFKQDVNSDVKEKLYEKTSDWLIDWVLCSMTAEEFTDYVVHMLDTCMRPQRLSCNPEYMETLMSEGERPTWHGNEVSEKRRFQSILRSFKTVKPRATISPRCAPALNIKDEERSNFTLKLKKKDRKKVIGQLHGRCIKALLSIIQSEKQVDINFDIHRFQYIPEFNSEHDLQYINLSSVNTIQITTNEVNHFMSLSDLSEFDRFQFLARVKVAACFNANDNKGDVIIIRRPNISQRRLAIDDGYTILFYKNERFRKISDFSRSEIYFAYASNRNSQTLVFYHKNTGEVTRWLLNDFVDFKTHPILAPLGDCDKPVNVKSLALTAAQDLLILIDSNSNVYSIDISREDVAMLSLLSKSTNNSAETTNFVSNDGEPYQAVQTIGEKSPIFFFQSRSYVDIIDQNYCQIFSIKLKQNSEPYKMQIFTDFVNTCCVLFNARSNEAYSIQNLISDSRIERQNKSDNADTLSQGYIGNRLLDIIKKGEIQFGVSDSSDETRYHMIVRSEYSSYVNKIKQYFRNIAISADLTIERDVINMDETNIDIDSLIKTIISRVPLQLCTIEMGTLNPLNNGRRERIDYLSSETFKIEMKAREISFSHLDYILNNLHENDNIRIIGIIGRQSTGKSYLLNQIYRTRFAVSAGRCTDGIWMSYAYYENIHYLILDCEGLFSDQRTDDEEIKLISFLTAVCDITILSQDTSFNRFQDRLFVLLSQAVKKINKNEKLFKGILLVAIRDISSQNWEEAMNATEKKFFDLQSKGKSGFLEQLFSGTFQLHLLHHFEDRNFDYEVKGLREMFLKTELDNVHRWENGKILSDRLKILLIQLYTDDFIDSGEIHLDMKLALLNERMKKAWAQFYFENEENFAINKQIIEIEFKNQNYAIELNHDQLYLDENTSNQNFDNIYEFISNAIYLQLNSRTETNEEKNMIQELIGGLILEVINYRREQVNIWITEKFKQEFPMENSNNTERRTKFLSTIEQYMLSFKINMCLRKCSVCDLKCVKNSQHTNGIKITFEKTKEELRKHETLLGETIVKNIEDQIKNLKDDIEQAEQEESKLREEMNSLSIELNYLTEKENIEIYKNECKSKIAAEKRKIEDIKQKLNTIDQEMDKLLIDKDDLQSIDQLLQRLNQEILSMLNPAAYNNDQLKSLIDTFHKNYQQNNRPEHDLLCFPLKEQVAEEFSMMNENIDRISQYSLFIQEHLPYIEQQLKDSKEKFIDDENEMRILENEKASIEEQKEDIEKSIEEDSTEYEDITQMLTMIDAEKENLSNDEMKFSVPEKIRIYLKKLQDKRNNCSCSYVSNDYRDIEKAKQQETQKLEFFLKEKNKKENIITTMKEELQALSDPTRIEGCEAEIKKNEEILEILLAKIDITEKKILAIDNHQSALQQIDEEYDELKRLMQTIEILDEQVQSKKVLLTQYMQKINEKDISVKTLEEEDSFDEIDQEDEELDELHEQKEKISNEMSKLEEQISNLCTANPLLSTVLNDPQFDIENQQKLIEDHFNELSQRSESLNNKLELVLNSLLLKNTILDELEQELLNINKKIQEKYNIHEQYKIQVQIDEELHTSGKALLPLLDNIQNLLKANLERSNIIIKIRSLVQECASLPDELKSAEQELKRLTAEKDTINKQLSEMMSSSATTEFNNSQACNEKYQEIVTAHTITSSHFQELSQKFLDLDVYYRLKKEVETLEKETQEKCDCETDHKCSGICQICAGNDENIKMLCIFKAGHKGEHKCDSGHICTRFCQICEIYGISSNRCHFAYGHKEPEHHQCERVHQCPAPCNCTEPCTIPLGLKSHRVHQCGKTKCWKQCIFDCGKECAVEDHNHDVTAEFLMIVDGDKTRSVKKHLCNEPHYCKGICEEPGVCEREHKVTTVYRMNESGEETPYILVEDRAIRNKCGMIISAGQYSHDDISYHRCGGRHTCEERCPDCGSFCRNLYGHSGFHTTIHRNKDQHVFTSTNPNDHIEIDSIGTYKVGDFATLESCAMSCKRRGRSHFHLIECPGGYECWENKLGNQAKHSNDTYYYGVNDPCTKKFDKILCSTYWSQQKWISPVDNDDKKLIDSCNTYCVTHVRYEGNGSIMKDLGARGFCTLQAWHSCNHLLECHNDHPTLELYDGIDVCFVIDTTGSMIIYFEKVRKAISLIIDKYQALLKNIKSKCDFKFSIIDYRDHKPEGDYVYRKCDFTDHIEAMQYVTNLKEGLGGDYPEAVLDGLDAACDLTWRDNADHLLFHILDAPPHGKIYHTSPNDRWPDGCPCGKTAESVFNRIKSKNISYHVLHCTNNLNRMINEFKNHINVKKLKVNTTIALEDAVAKQVFQRLTDTGTTVKKT